MSKTQKIVVAIAAIGAAVLAIAYFVQRQTAQLASSVAGAIRPDASALGQGLGQGLIGGLFNGFAKVFSGGSKAAGNPSNYNGGPTGGAASVAPGANSPGAADYATHVQDDSAPGAIIIRPDYAAGAQS